jgi:hypothetical protein
MKEFTDLDGRRNKINLTKYITKYNNKSGLHLRARELIHNIFPFDPTGEEVPIQVTRSQTLYADFFIPSRKLMIECHGQQHYEHTAFFHKTKKEFNLAKARDNNKAEWCRINNIRLVVLPYDDEDNWENLIRGT